MNMKCENEMCTPPNMNGRHDLLDQLFAAQSCMASQAKLIPRRTTTSPICRKAIKGKWQKQNAILLNPGRRAQEQSSSCLVYVTTATVHHVSVSVHILKCETICSLLKGRHLLAAAQS